MRLRQIVQAGKTNISLGSWHNGKVPRADFPISRKAYRLGKSYEWRVVKFDALGVECRVLVVVNKPKQKYEAVLGVMGPQGSLKVICSYEYHPSEPGWHCHATHDDVNTIPHGCMRGPWIQRRPGARKPHRQAKYERFKIGDRDDAIRFALRRYKVETKGSLL